MQNTKLKAAAVLAVLFVGIGFLFMSKTYFSGHRKSKSETETEETQRATPEKGEILARKAYRIALPYAKKWANDAYLVEITNYIGTKSTDGKSSMWKVRFYSPSKNQDYRISITDGKFKGGSEGAHMSLSKIVDNWINSDAVMNIANKYLLKENCQNYWLGITGDTWNVKCSRENKEPLWIEINALTGEKTGERVGY